MIDIKDKELLAFVSATNLDWHFAELMDEGTGKRKNNIFLNDFLTPESFVRVDNKGTDKEIRTPVYGEDNEKAFIKMQNSAGVLMNYLEECEFYTYFLKKVALRNKDLYIQQTSL